MTETMQIGEAEAAITRNYGHPWHGKGEWDLMEIRGKTKNAVCFAIQNAEKKFWQVWIKGTTESIDYPFGAAMYKPSGIAKVWTDPGP
jgi:hypothetical protein